MNGEIGMCDLRSSDYPNYKVAGETACDKFNALTVFQQITQSPEVLAERLVIMVAYFYPKGVVKWFWRSTIAKGNWETKEEAYNATVAKLKEVCDAEGN
jgi:hypothetical protein